MGSVYNRGTRAAPSWWVDYRDENGKRHRNPSNQPTERDARAFLAAVEARIANGKVGIVRKTPEERARHTITLRELEARFSAEYAPPRLKDIAEYRKQTRSVFDCRILPTLGDRAAASLTSLDVERLRDALLAPVAGVRDGYAPKSVSWTMARLSKVYVWGRKVGAIDCASPVVGVEHPKGESSLDFLSREEVSKLLAYVEEHRPDIHAMLATAIYAFLRKGELYGLRWRDVHLDAGRLDVARSYTLAPKSGKARYLPLHPELARILRWWRDRCPKTDEGLVFPVPDVCGGHRMGKKSEMLGLAVVLKAAGCHVLEPKVWHGLRHTGASHFIMAGGNILTLQKLLGHADLTMTMIYAHLAPDFMSAEIARMSFATPTANIASLEEQRRLRALDTPGAHDANTTGATG